ncbi:hypothetical protein F4680DRAFT_131972 [Xylaria scruposa]|nr:hypothetical protein F4680DRAFT_131972 [Xylaria scruposa]
MHWKVLTFTCIFLLRLYYMSTCSIQPDFRLDSYNRPKDTLITLYTEPESRYLLGLHFRITCGDCKFRKPC